MMRVTLVIALLLLAACSPEPRVSGPQTLDVFERAQGQSFYCDFYATDVAEDAPARHVFGTIFDDPQRRARMSFGEEMLMLFPVGEGAAFDPQGEETIYSVENYPDYDVRVTHARTGEAFERVAYEGVVQFRRYEDRTPAVIAERAYQGSCGV